MQEDHNFDKEENVKRDVDAVAHIVARNFALEARILA